MKLRSRVILPVFALMGIAMTGCSDDNPWVGTAGNGGIRLSLAADGNLMQAAPTRATESLTPPDINDFSIILEKTDGSYSHSWATLAAFQNETEFPTGTYTITAAYGNAESEGFDAPYYKGEATVTVLEAREQEVNVTATLQNSMVQISYTDAFKTYFSQYATTLHSEGHSYVEMPQYETRAAYIAPGVVDVAVKVTKPNGQSVTLQPAKFTAKPRTKYNITYDVNNGAIGEAQLTVTFDETLVQENVEIDLTDELFLSQPPYLKAVGFEDGASFESLTGDFDASRLRYNVIARGGLRECMLTIASDSYTPPFGKEINLVKATPAEQQQLAALGIEAKGLYGNVDQMAYVDISRLPSMLPSGTYVVSLMAKDGYTRVSDPISVTFNSVPQHLEVTPQIGIFGVNEATLTVDYNGAKPEQDITFKALNKYGAMADCKVLSVTESTPTRAIAVRQYVFQIALPDAERDEIPVKVYLKGREMKSVNVRIIQPEYAVEVDAYAHKAVMQISAEPGDRETVTTLLNVFANGTLVPESNITRQAANGLIIISNLQAGTDYELTTDFSRTMSGKGKKVAITTEAATSIPNGDFSATTETINMQNVRVGGYYQVAWYKNNGIVSSIVRSEANGWASINQKTCWTGATNNTWFRVPSTFVENGQTIVRSVAYDHQGTTPATSGGFTNTRYYCENAPSFSDANKVAGELFLGTYSFNGAESRSEGILFASRPTSLSFDYRYASQGNEQGLARIEVLDGSGNVLTSGEMQLGATGEMTTKTIPLGAYTFGSKAARIKVSFKSATGNPVSVYIPTGTALYEPGSGSAGKDRVQDANSYRAYASGSELVLDNVKLNY